MVSIESVVLWTHIVFGVIALGAGLGALVTTKGSFRHIRSGQIFVTAMVVVLVLVPTLLVIDPTISRQILTLVAIFTGYFVFAGYRAVTRKQQANTPTIVDWAAVGVLVVVGIGLIGWGLMVVVGGEQFGIVMAAFGGIALVFGIADILRFDPAEDPMWMMTHVTRIIGAYIATVTAVSATNLTMFPTLVRWLWPTAVGVPLILYFQAKYGNIGPLTRWVAE